MGTRGQCLWWVPGADVFWSMILRADDKLWQICSYCVCKVVVPLMASEGMGNWREVLWFGAVRIKKEEVASRWCSWWGWSSADAGAWWRVEVTLPSSSASAELVFLFLCSHIRFWIQKGRRSEWGSMVGFVFCFVWCLLQLPVGIGSCFNCWHELWVTYFWCTVAGV